MNNLDGRDLLPDTSALGLRGIEQDSDSWVVEANAPAIAACPDCGVSLRARHSSYSRQLKDLPIQGRSVRLKLRVSRWRCRNPTCKRKIFCQRLPSVPGKHAQETNRFTEILQSVGYALGGRAGKRLSVRLGLRISDDTMLRRVKRAARSRPQGFRISDRPLHRGYYPAERGIPIELPDPGPPGIYYLERFITSRSVLPRSTADRSRNKFGFTMVPGDGCS